jgi:hypothetical protein
MKNNIKKITGSLDDFKATLTKPIGKTKDINVLSDDGLIVTTMSDDLKAELGYTSNVLKVEKRSHYPLGSGQQDLVEEMELIIGKNSQLPSLQAAIDYCAALIDLYTVKYLNIKLIDKKFTTKTYYVISSEFSDSNYLNISSVKIGDKNEGAQYLTDADIENMSSETTSSSFDGNTI